MGWTSSLMPQPRKASTTFFQRSHANMDLVHRNFDYSGRVGGQGLVNLFANRLSLLPQDVHGRGRSSTPTPRRMERCRFQGVQNQRSWPRHSTHRSSPWSVCAQPRLYCAIKGTAGIQRVPGTSPYSNCVIKMES